jgi:hypothetical protein
LGNGEDEDGVMKGKNYSCNNTGKRKKSDFYQTPYSMTEQLLKKEDFNKNKWIFEPCAGEFGEGAILKVLQEKHERVMHNDISYGQDFIKMNIERNDISYVITNPPFSKAFEFIQKSKKIAKEKIAMLLPLSYLHGQKRYEEKVFREENYPLTKVYVFTRYPLLEDTIRDDGKYKTGMMVYAWYIWEEMDYATRHCENCNQQYPVIKWIDNNKYVLRKGE